jgi:hypothetical protein
MTRRTRLSFTFIRTLSVLFLLSYRLAFLLASGNLCYIPLPSHLSPPNYPTVIWWRKKIVTLRNKPAVLWDMTLCRLVDRFWRVSGQTSCLSVGQKTSTQNMRAARSTVAVALTYRTTRRREPHHLDHGTHCRNSFISHYGAVFPVKMCHTSCAHNHEPPGTPAAPLRRVATSRLSCGLLRISWSLAAPLSTVSCRQ